MYWYGWPSWFLVPLWNSAYQLVRIAGKIVGPYMTICVPTKDAHTCHIL